MKYKVWDKVICIKTCQFGKLLPIIQVDYQFIISFIKDPSGEIWFEWIRWYFPKENFELVEDTIPSDKKCSDLLHGEPKPRLTEEYMDNAIKRIKKKNKIYKTSSILFQIFEHSVKWSLWEVDITDDEFFEYLDKKASEIVEL